MEKGDRELLLKDLSARVPYRPYVLLGEKEHCILCGIDGYDVYLNIDSDSFSIGSIKPYLHPMSSMTEEERSEWANLFNLELNKLNEISDEDKAEELAPYYFGKCHQVSIDWLNSHHFDYRGLIEKGLALEALEGMYK